MIFDSPLLILKGPMSIPLKVLKELVVGYRAIRTNDIYDKDTTDSGAVIQKGPKRIIQ